MPEEIPDTELATPQWPHDPALEGTQGADEPEDQK